MTAPVDETLVEEARALHRAGDLAGAAAAYTGLLQAAPDDHDLNLGLGAVLCAMGRGGDAIVHLERCLRIRTDVAEVYFQRAAARVGLGRVTDAIADIGEGLKRAPGNAEALITLIASLQKLGRYGDLLEPLERLAALRPEMKEIAGVRLEAAQALCDWDMVERLRTELEAPIRQGRVIVQPQALLMTFDDPVLLRAGTEHYQRHYLRDVPEPPPPAYVARCGRIRVAYVSADFRNHATANLISDLIARHDRTRFEIIGVSTGPDDGSYMRSWLIRKFDRFLDATGKHDRQVADALRAMETDIAVDLNGHTRAGRPGLFKLRVAPVQVNFLGFPGTMAADFMDYLIADQVLVLDADQAHYSEHIVHLPDSYQPNSPMRPRPPPPARGAVQLPEKGFVFCSFNQHIKITRPVFGIWMELLAQVPGSVLWLLKDTADAPLRAAAQGCGIDPARLVFAPKMGLHEHLARIGLADLALDTAPCNGHTTTSDALWMGVPVVTVAGRAFAGRVSASLLSACALPQLVAPSLEAYRDLALGLARDPHRLGALRRHLSDKRASLPLFDAERFCRNIEKAYTVMAKNARRYRAPAGFQVG